MRVLDDCVAVGIGIGIGVSAASGNGLMVLVGLCVAGAFTLARWTGEQQ